LDPTTEPETLPVVLLCAKRAEPETKAIAVSPRREVMRFIYELQRVLNRQDRFFNEIEGPWGRSLKEILKVTPYLHKLSI
jgi:hypothetical protein